MVEKASGLPLDEFIRTRITGPLGLKDTRFFVSPPDRNRLAAVPQQSFVDRSPPDASGRLRVERLQHSAPDLPAHEREGRPAERQVPRSATDRSVVGPRHQCKPRCRIVAYGADLGFGQGECASLVTHRHVDNADAWTRRSAADADLRHSAVRSCCRRRSSSPPRCSVPTNTGAACRSAPQSGQTATFEYPAAL